MDLSIGGYVQVFSVHMIVFQDKINVVLFVGHKCDIDVWQGEWSHERWEIDTAM